jgi:hypothetical protein
MSDCFLTQVCHITLEATYDETVMLVHHIRQSMRCIDNILHLGLADK